MSREKISLLKQRGGHTKLSADSIKSVPSRTSDFLINKYTFIPDEKLKMIPH